MKFYLGYLFFLVGIPAIILASSCKKEKKAEAINRVDPILNIVATLDGSEEKFMQMSLP